MPGRPLPSTSPPSSSSRPASGSLPGDPSSVGGAAAGAAAGAARGGLVPRERCPACGEPGGEPLYDRPYDAPPISTYLERYYRAQGAFDPAPLAGARFQLDGCRRCGLIWQRQAPDEALARELYEAWIDPETARRRFLDGRSLKNQSRCAGELMLVLGMLARRPREVTLLDFGMGWGKWCLMARAFWCPAWGMELSPARLAHARELGLPTLTWEELDGRRFDFVNTEQVFEHLAEPVPVLRRLAAALAPGGLIKLSVPNGHGMRRRLRRLERGGDDVAWTARGRASLVPVRPLEHLNCFDHRALGALATAAGLEPVPVPIARQLASAAGWSSPREAAEALLRPFYRNLLRRGTYRFFRRAGE